jgi:hypothetical protein
VPSSRLPARRRPARRRSARRRRRSAARCRCALLPRARGGATPGDREALATARRGEQLTITAQTSYRRDYDWHDVCRAGAAIKAGTLTLESLKDPMGETRREYKVPFSSMQR